MAQSKVLVNFPIQQSQMLNGAGLFSCIYLINASNVGEYSSSMEHLGNGGSEAIAFFFLEIFAEYPLVINTNGP